MAGFNLQASRARRSMNALLLTGFGLTVAIVMLGAAIGKGLA